jgi:hypothetical protein
MSEQKRKGDVIRKSNISYTTRDQESAHLRDQKLARIGDQNSLCEYKRLINCKKITHMRKELHITGTDRNGVLTVHMECIKPFRMPRIRYSKYNYMDFYTRAASSLTLSTRSTSETLT